MTSGSFILLLLFFVAQGDGCTITEMQKSVLGFLTCLKANEKVNLDREAQEIEEACRHDHANIKRCNELHFEQILIHCRTDEEEKIAEMMNNMMLAQKQFFCDEDVSIIKEFWASGGVECTKLTLSRPDSKKCFDRKKIPNIFSDYNDPETCNQQLEQLRCLADGFPAECSDLEKKVIYTYFKRGMMATACRDTVIKEDNRGLEITTEAPNPAPTDPEQSKDNSEPSLVSNIAFPILTTIFALCLLFI